MELEEGLKLNFQDSESDSDEDGKYSEGDEPVIIQEIINKKEHKCFGSF